MPRCCVTFCGRPTEAGAGKGLSLTHCRYHLQRRSRFGSFWKGNLPAATLRPYQQAAARFIAAHQADAWVSAAMKGLDATMVGAGPKRHPSDTSSRFVSPRDKARAALARLREAEIPAERLLVAYLAVAAAIAEDPIKPGGEPGEYRRVQAAKAVFRLASGYHSVYGPGPRQRFDRYPRSAGRVLRELGAMLEEVCEHVRDEHLPAIIAMAHGQAPTPSATPPAPHPSQPGSTSARDYPTGPLSDADLARLYP